MSKDPTEEEFWQNQDSATFIAGLKTPGGETAERMGLEERNPVFNQRKTELLEEGHINFLGRGNDELEIDNENAVVTINGEDLSEYNERLEEMGLGDLTMLSTASFVPSNEYGGTNFRRKNFGSDENMTHTLNQGELNMVNPPIVHDLAHDKPTWEEYASENMPVPISNILLRYCKQGTDGAELAQEQFGVDKSEFPTTTEEAVQMFEDDFGALREITESARTGDYEVMFYKPINGSGGDHTGLYSVEGIAEDVIRAYDADLFEDDGERKVGKGQVGITIPHLGDIRAVMSNSGFSGNEDFTNPQVWLMYERVGCGDQIQSNLDELPESIKQNIEKLEERGHIGTINHSDNPEGLEGVYNMSEATLYTVQDYSEDQGLNPETLGRNVGVVLGIDCGVLNHTHQLFEELPQPVKDFYTQEEFSISTDRIVGDKEGYQPGDMYEEDRAHLVAFEANVSPGLKGDKATDDPRTNTVYNLRHFMDGMSWKEEFEVGGFLEYNG